MTFRQEIIGDATLILGDCREVIGGLQDIDAVVSDPPYGMNWNTDTTRFGGGHSASVARRGQGRADWGAVSNDDQPFDPKPFLGYNKVILWGANHYASRLPVGTTLVWIKRLDPAFGSFLSDAELAWMKGGHGVYCKRDLSNAALSGKRDHPTQKPIGLMEWCVQKVSPANTILDPFMGSGTTGVACLNLGRAFVGVEIEERFFDVACRRLEAAVGAPRLFAEPVAKPVNESMDFGAAA